MREWFRDNKIGLLALVITIVAWLGVASLLPNAVLSAVHAFAFGWFFLGDVVQPWVEAKIRRWL